jgi:hypothetical protein
MFLLLPDSMETFREWRRLVVQHNVIGAKVHDTRLVATMKVHGLDRILTFNMQDFIRYEGVTAIHPESVRWTQTVVFFRARVRSKRARLVARFRAGALQSGFTPLSGRRARQGCLVDLIYSGLSARHTEISYGE